MILLQITAITIAIIYLYMSYYYLKRKIFNKSEFLFWAFIWLGFMIVSITPTSFNFILETFNIHRMMDLMMIIAFVIIYMLGYKNYVGMKKIENNFTTFVQNDALSKIKEND